MRRFPVGLLALFLLLGSPWASPPDASAQPQSQSPVTLTLLSQSAWNSPRRPLDISVRATNTTGDALTSLSVVLSIGAPARARTIYDLSLHGDATTTIFALSFPQRRTLGPKASRVFNLHQPLDQVPGLAETGVYPLKLLVLAAVTPVATLRTPMVFLTEKAKVPLNLTWTWALETPLQLEPNGTFLPGPLERDVAPGGRIAALVDAIGRAGGSAADVAVSPVLLDQLARMASGYRVLQADGTIRTVPRGTGGAVDAAHVLETLRVACARPAIETSALPYGDPVLPSLVRSGLGEDIPALLTRGRSAAAAVLHTSVDRTILRPPLSLLDATSLAALTSSGTTTVLVDPNSVPAPSGLAFSPPPIVRLVAGSVSTTAVVPDDGVATVAAAYRTDPELAAHATLGELAAIWLEFPGTPNRGAAALFSERSSLQPSFYGTFASLVRASPWLTTVTASRLTRLVAETGREPLPGAAAPALNPTLVARLIGARSVVAEFHRAARDSAAMVTRLSDDLFLSQGGTALDDPALGIRYIGSVEQAVRRTYSQVRVTSGLVTLASQNGHLPVVVSNKSGFPLTADLRLLSDRRLTFVGGSNRVVVLPASSSVFTFLVRAQATGRFPVKVQILTSPGPTAQTIAETEMVVHSTAYNRVALFLTIGAALFLLVWWGRRFLPRRGA